MVRLTTSTTVVHTIRIFTTSCLNMEKMYAAIFLIYVSCVCAESVESEPAYAEAFLERESYALPEVPYNYSALEPLIDVATMRVHHLGHHAGYTAKLNQVLKDWRESGEEKELASKSIIEILKSLDKVPPKFQHYIRNLGGGYFNHALYWATMSPNPDGVKREPGETMSWLIQNTFETNERFERWVKHEALNLFGSGNLWISVDPNLPTFVTINTLYNQDTPFSQGLFPLFLVDVWEHAYYLKHQNKRAEYLDAWWKLINWDAVEKLIKKWGVNPRHDEL